MLEVIERDVACYKFAVRWVGEDEPCADNFFSREAAEKWIVKLERALRAGQ